MDGNSISVITPLSSLTKLEELYMSYNKIADVSIVESKPLVVYQAYHQSLSAKGTEGDKLDLPAIFLSAKTSNTKVFTSEPLSVVNGTLSSNGNQVILGGSSSTTSVTIVGGVLDDSEFIVDVEKLPSKDDDIPSNIDDETPLNNETPSDISGSSSNDPTLSDNILPFTGIGEKLFLFLLILAIAMAVVSYFKYRYIKFVK